MKATRYRFKTFPGRIVTGTLLTLISLFVCSQAMASTAANTAIVNTVQLTYTSGATNYSDSDSITVTVDQQYAAPAFTDISTSTSSTTEAQPVNQLYGVYSQSNGSDTYDISVAINESANLSTETGTDLNGTAGFTDTITLGATALAQSAANGATALVVPTGSTTDLAAGDLIQVAGTTYRIASIAAATPSAAYDTINLDTTNPHPVTGVTYTALQAALNPGTLIGEFQALTLDFTTGTLTVATGTHTPVLTGVENGSGTSGTTNHNGQVVTVNRALVSVTKEVNVGAGFTSGAGITSTPGSTITYRITVANTGSGATAINLFDTLSPYVAIAAPTPLVFADSGSGLNFGTATITYRDASTASITPTIGGGGATGNFDARVADWRVDFGAQTMAASSSFTLTYDVLIQ